MHDIKKTKIVATIGPATESVEMLSKLLNAGMNVMRMNFSHGSYEEHQGQVESLREAMKKTGISAAMMQDLAGPKIRIGDFSTEFVTLKEGQTFTITTDQVVGNDKRVSVNYEPLPREVKKGGFILLHDGKKKLEILDIKGNDVICKVIVGGDIKGRRGVNLPGAHLSISSLTDKDKKDIEFGIKNNVEFIAFSFVRRAEDIKELRSILDQNKSQAAIIAKVEDTEGLENIDKIIELVDGVMVARGDMAIEIGAENVPMVQKTIIYKCNKLGKMVITATHMLESMINNPVPTRAEVSDIANAIIDGTDAIMLSEETTLGKFPVEAVTVMSRVALKIENDPLYREDMLARKNLLVKATESTVDAITGEVFDLASRIQAKCIVAMTHTGFTAQMIARYRPEQPILAFTPSDFVSRQLLLSYGCIPVHNKKFATLTSALSEIRKMMIKKGYAEKGDKIIILGGIPFEKQKDTNMLLVETI